MQPVGPDHVGGPRHRAPAAPHDGCFDVEGGQQPEQGLGDAPSAEDGDRGPGQADAGLVAPRPGPCPPGELAEPGQPQGQGVLRHRL